MSTVEPIRDKKDIKKVEKILSKQGQRDLLLFTIGTNCGLRISDILRLNVADVKNKTHIQITEKKTGKFKKFPINSKLKPMLDDFIMGRKNDEPLFLSRWGHRLDGCHWSFGSNDVNGRNVLGEVKNEKNICFNFNDVNIFTGICC